MERKPTPRADIGLGVFLIVICSGVLFESRKIPPGTFEPLGSAPVPQAVAAGIIVLSLLMLAQAWRQLRRGVTSDGADEVQPRPRDAAMIIAASVVYAAALHYRVLDFPLLTSAYLLITIVALMRFERRVVLPAAVVSVLMGYGSYYVFTQIFTVDLPGAY